MRERTMRGRAPTWLRPRVVGLVLVLLIALTLPEKALAAKRIALVIGNSAYGLGSLPNPVNDASAVASALSQLGFDKVILKKDLAAEGMRKALRELGRDAVGSDIAVIFFAGHGMELAGRNYLLPVDVRLERASDVELEAISLDIALQQLDGARRLKLVVLDACRSNVFRFAGGKRDASRGLARIEPEDNTLVAYAARAGTTADDGVGRRHSPFTTALLKHIATPGLDVRILLGRVRDEVMAATHREQQPHIYGTLGGQAIYLKEPAAALPIPRPEVDEESKATEARRHEALRRAEEAKRAGELRRQDALKAQEAAKLAEEQRLAAMKAAEEARTGAEAESAKPRNDSKQGLEPTKLAALPKPEKPLTQGSFDGRWTGAWGGRAGTSVIISGNRVVRYYYKGQPVPITRSTLGGSTATFGSETYTVNLTFRGSGSASAHYRHHVRGDTAEATLTRQ